MRSMRVRDVMSSPAITTSPAMSLREVQRLMELYHLRHVPVLDHGTPVGIISGGDMRRAIPIDPSVLSAEEWHILLDTVRADEIMTPVVITVDADAPIADAATLMLQQRVSSLPVVENGRMVGIITDSDLLQIIAADVLDRAAVPHL